MKLFSDLFQFVFIDRNSSFSCTENLPNAGLLSSIGPMAAVAMDDSVARMTRLGAEGKVGRSQSSGFRWRSLVRPSFLFLGVFLSVSPSY